MPPLFHKAGKWLKEYGAIAPSSHFLAQEMVRPIAWHTVRVAVEFGAGSGAITREVLKQLPTSARLIAFEINQNACEKLRAIDDSRLTVVNDRAENAARYLNGKKADCVLSGVPIANLYSHHEFYGFLHAAQKNLKLGGLFVQFQYFLVSYPRIRRSFRQVKIHFSLLNIPPAFIYICRN